MFHEDFYNFMRLVTARQHAAPSKTEHTVTVQTVTVIDCMGSNLDSLGAKPGQIMAGYVTGTGDVPWTDAQFAAHPGAVRIDQSPIDTPADETADVLDVEPQAATLADIPAWVHGAWTSWRTGRRPGQRKPALYVNHSELTPVANTLNAAGITNGVNLWLAAPMSETDAASMLQTAGGPFPIIAVQYAFQSLFDVSVVSKEWLDDVSQGPVKTQTPANTQQDWLICGKCTSLFYGPLAATSVCPAGGNHNGEHSHSYVIGYLP